MDWMIVVDVDVELLKYASLERLLHPAEENKHQSRGDEATSHHQSLTGGLVIGSQTPPTLMMFTCAWTRDRFIVLRSKSTIKSAVRVPVSDTVDVGWNQSL